MIRLLWKRYAAYVRIGAIQARQARGELYGCAVFFAVILGVFSSLWRVAAMGSLPVAADAAHLVWYLAVTEWIILSAPILHLEMQHTVRSGDVTVHLGRPIAFPAAVFAEGLGRLLARAPFLGATAVACAFAFTGWVPPLARLGHIVFFGLLGAALITAMHVGIGLLAFWLDDVTPVYWVWQKLLFILGGLMLPLQIYPTTLQRIAYVTPFPVVLAEPASLVLGTSAATLSSLAWACATWTLVIAAGVWWIFRAAKSTVTFTGG